MRLTATSLLAFAALISTGGAAPAQRQFNGTWSVEVITEKGDCDRAYRYAVVIENGNIRYGGSEGFDVSGSVNARGTIRGSIARGAARADVAGWLSGRTGAGTWTTSGRRSCSGRWNAERRS